MHCAHLTATAGLADLSPRPPTSAPPPPHTHTHGLVGCAIRPARKIFLLAPQFDSQSWVWPFVSSDVFQVQEGLPPPPKYSEVGASELTHKITISAYRTCTIIVRSASKNWERKSMSSVPDSLRWCCWGTDPATPSFSSFNCAMSCRFNFNLTPDNLGLVVSEAELGFGATQTDILPRVLCIQVISELSIYKLVGDSQLRRLLSALISRLSYPRTMQRPPTISLSLHFS